MTDEPKFRALPLEIASQIYNPEIMAGIDRACKLALQKQLNKNESDPKLKALADKWKTMDSVNAIKK